MVIVKTSELEGAALDYAVAIGQELTPRVLRKGIFINNYGYSPSTNWSQGGPIIEREKISHAFVGKTLLDAMAPHEPCSCAHIDGSYTYYAETPLIAAMCCYVASKLGHAVDIPDELV